MIIDGRAIAKQILTSIAVQTKAMPNIPTLGVVTCNPNVETKQYLELKRRKAKQVGVDLVILELPETVSTADCVAHVFELADNNDGVLVQLPLPKHIDREVVLAAVPVEQDPDGFAYGKDEKSVQPPVVAAIDVIATETGIVFKGTKVTVLGNGRLVGQPAAAYAKKRGAKVTVLTEGSPDYAETIKAADILICGVGKPHFITPEMVKDGVIVFDAGASEDGGEVVGDVDPTVAEKSQLFTPVPGGIGPITVAVLLQNVLKLLSTNTA